ncbi:MAG: DNA/RNA helicase domain-containing protein [Vicinamibacterales bacterium]
MTERRAGVGWESTFPEFAEASALDVRKRLKAFVADASPEQERAWADSIPPLQDEVEEVLSANELASKYSAILEYELPLESRRPDAILLVGGGLLVIELKGKLQPSQADVDQAAAYARDLQSYHRECEGRPVIPVLVPTRARGYQRQEGAVHIAGPDALDALVRDITDLDLPPISREDFLDENAYRPLPTLVKAARELLASGQLRRIERAHAATEPTVKTISDIVHEAARTKTRHLILVTGLPGAGKTLVGLQAVHAHYLDDLAIDRGSGKPTAPAVFLSGNGPLVQVLQYELKDAGGGGRVFVRDVKNYVKTYSKNDKRVPPEHVLVYDEAQRAFDAEMVKITHKEDDAAHHKSEPALFVEFANRVPEWCVVIGLIGTGQEIHVGEEGGIVQWRRAVENNPRWREWHIHTPPAVFHEFDGAGVPVRKAPALSLNTELRQHRVEDLHEYVAGLLAPRLSDELARLATQLERDGFHFRITRELHVAKAYLRERYAENPDARFGIVASARDKSLQAFGVNNDFQSTKRTKFGPWYGDGDESPFSCRRLTECVTEFGAQGLELDAALLAWGTDFRLINGEWSNTDASGYKLKRLVRDALQLRRNAYRVLLTRARDAVVVFVPSMPVLDETYTYLVESGFTRLSPSEQH